MSDIVLSMQSGEPVASSRQIADNFEKRHDHVMRDIDAMKKDVPNFGEMFFETTVPDSYGREQRAYLMNVTVSPCWLWGLPERRLLSGS